MTVVGEKLQKNRQAVYFTNAQLQVVLKKKVKLYRTKSSCFHNTHRLQVVVLTRAVAMSDRC